MCSTSVFCLLFDLGFIYIVGWVFGFLFVFKLAARCHDRKGFVSISRRKLPKIPGLFKLLFCALSPHRWTLISKDEMLTRLLSISWITLCSHHHKWYGSGHVVMVFHTSTQDTVKQSCCSPFLTEGQHNNLMISGAMKYVSLPKMICCTGLLSATQRHFVTWLLSFVCQNLQESKTAQLLAEIKEYHVSKFIHLSHNNRSWVSE